jgi:RimJ/RimL family protein N-acetyltransferase
MPESYTMPDLIKVNTEAGIVEVAELAAVIWNEYFPAIIGQAQVDYMVDKFQSKTAIQAQIDDGYVYYLIRLGHTNAGYVGVIHQPRLGRMQISKFYILKAYRGRGLARQLLAGIMPIAAAQGYGCLYLTVNKYNADTISIYERLGFVKTGALVMDIGGGYVMDDYSMELSIPRSGET